MEFQLSYFSPKRWCFESAALNMSANLENSAVATGLKKVSFHSNPKKGNAKECSNYHRIALISHSSVLAWRIPGIGEPGGLLSMGLHRVGHDWSDLAAAAAHASKVMLKILQARFQQYVNHELPDVQAEFTKGRGTRYQIANIPWIMEKAREFQKNVYFCLIDYTKAFDFMDHNKLWKFLKRWEYQITLPASWEICMQVKKQQLELDME